MCSQYTVEDQMDICEECGKCVMVFVEEHETEICSP